ncbi:MAG: hypothetical protein M3N98_09540 [Actinomycetota bacterium]|nr:hypothetical protein [Actinomycetota bacterium]
MGAILRYAVTVTTRGIDLHTVGDILMIAGIAAVVVSLFFWSSWGGFGGMARRRPTTTVYERDVIDRDRTLY